MDRINAPFTDQEVENLNKYQQSGLFHPFTCGGSDWGIEECERANGTGEGLLTATSGGWVCPCGKYKQDWAWDFMASDART